MSNTVSRGIISEEWGKSHGNAVTLFRIINAKGSEIKITNYGGIITSWIVADKSDDRSNIVLGFDTLEEYFAAPPYFGAIIGRCANRIAKGKFGLDGKEYTLATNNGPNHLHGGNKGFDKVVWSVDSVDESKLQLVLSYLSKDGEEGYPGNLKVKVRYEYSDDDKLTINYEAECDKATPVNLTNHSYFNLTGDVQNTILDHFLTINADQYTPVDETLIPTGELKDVTNSPFDFRTAKRIGEDIQKTDGGFDHNFVLNTSNLERPAAVLKDEKSGRSLEVYTTQPGIQFYSGNFLDGSLTTSSGTAINQHTGLCLETQHFPDTPNQFNFPTTILRPGERFVSTTRYKVSLLDK